MNRFTIDPLDLLNFPRHPEQEVVEWVKTILAAKGIDAGKVTGINNNSNGMIVVECED